jgi:hypothetical protein
LHSVSRHYVGNTVFHQPGDTTFANGVPNRWLMHLVHTFRSHHRFCCHAFSYTSAPLSANSFDLASMPFLTFAEHNSSLRQRPDGLTLLLCPGGLTDISFCWP